MSSLIVILFVTGFLLIGNKIVWNRMSYVHFGLFAISCSIIGLYTEGWRLFIEWEVVCGGVWNLSNLFASISWNDVSGIQAVSPTWVSTMLKFCYISGYIAMMIVPSVPCFLKGEFEQGWRYVLSGHLLQSILIMPFLILFSVQEVWWIKHIPDGLYRSFESDMAALKVSYNCFPSMHTSTATAMGIVAWNDKGNKMGRGRCFRWAWSFYCGLVIISTVYFPIHWLLDLLGGIALGVISVKIGTKLVKIIPKYFLRLKKETVERSKLKESIKL